MAVMSFVASLFKEQRLLYFFLSLLVIATLSGETFLFNNYSVSLS